MPYWLKLKNFKILSKLINTKNYSKMNKKDQNLNNIINTDKRIDSINKDNISRKRSNSQVFDNDDDIDNLNENKSDSTRRKSSWAFWKSDGLNDINNANNSNTTTNTNNESNNELNNGLDNETMNLNNDSYIKNNDTVKSVVIDGKEVITRESSSSNDDNNKTKERTYSWSFWSAKTKQNLNSNIILDQSIKNNTNKAPDVIKSNVNKSINLNNTNINNNNKSILKNKKSNILLNKQNLIIPTINETLPLLSTHNIIINGYKKFKKILGYNDTKINNLFRKDEPIIFKRVLIIGVHGFFPTKMIRPIIGEPTGTSMKFAQVGESAILSWAKENNLNIEIQKIALEKEGKIFDRVEFFFDILKNSINDIKKSDFIFVCSHSQGCPVSIILISKLLEYGIIDENKKISLLGMAGINIGPFYGMDKSLFVRAYSTIENESLLELFQFQNFESLQSRKFIESLKNLVRHNVKITFIGSIDDQLVPLYSSTALHVQHPNIYKAVYIDGSTNTPDFVSRIIKLSCILQNIGSTDHDVIKEISNSLAGPITGGGHSKIYNDLKVYKMALDFTLKTEDSTISIEQPIKFKPFDIKKLGNGSNPFNLPWCARGLFFEVGRNLPNGSKEIELVFKEFEEWEPDSKALKDVKYRLNGIRAKL